MGCTLPPGDPLVLPALFSFATASPPRRSLHVSRAGRRPPGAGSLAGGICPADALVTDVSPRARRFQTSVRSTRRVRSILSVVGCRPSHGRSIERLFDLDPRAGTGPGNGRTPGFRGGSDVHSGRTRARPPGDPGP